MSERLCAVCGAVLPARRRVTCSDRCRVFRNNHSEAYRRSKARYRERVGEPRFAITCSGCGAAATVTKRTARFCSNRCYQDHKLDLRPEPGTGLVHVGPLPRRTWEPVHVRVERPWVAGRCAWCGESFVFNQPAARFCSRRCQRACAKARERFVISPRRRAAIYERDGWTCQLCFEPVDSKLPPSDVWAATLDHIECQAWADEPDHSEGNLRLAHRWCNSVRGDESRHTAEDLVA